MEKLVILVSDFDDYSDRAEKISKDVAGTKYYYIEQIKKQQLKSLLKNKVIFFLTNTYKKIELINRIKKQNISCKILNDDFFKKNYNKLDMQRKILFDGVKIPKIYENEKDIEYPFFLKSLNHADFIAKIYNFNTLKRLDTKGCYYEQNIPAHKEYKVYFVNNEIFFSENVNKEIHKKIKNICSTISESLSIEIFSSDLLYNKTQFFVIDINPAPGLWNSFESRKALGEINCE